MRMSSAVLVAVLAACSSSPSTTRATSIAPPPFQPGAGAKAESAPLQAFACTEKRLDLSREALEKTAIQEYEKRGGRTERSQMKIRLVSKGCDWQVLVELLPAAPGAHFGVLIDGTTGKPKMYYPGS